VRTISPEARAAAHAEASDKVWLVLLEITAAGLSTPIRVANDNADVIHQGWTFIGYPFEVELPPESQDRPMIARIRIDNTERLIVDEVRSISEPPSVTLRVVLADQPDVIEVEYAGMRLRNVTWDAGEISGGLRADDSSAVSRSVLSAAHEILMDS
jgi:hypothetical protein